MPNGIHHIHKRKRVHQGLEEYPHKNPYINFLDQLLLVIAILGPIASIPQIMKIYMNKSAAGVSAFSFTLFTIFNIPWIVYGFVHKEKPIIIAYILWFISNLLVVIGTLMYS